MSSSPTRDQLASVLDALASRLASLETVMASFAGTSPPTATIGRTHVNVPEGFLTSLPKKKGKGKAAPKHPPTPHAPHCSQHVPPSTPKAPKAKGSTTIPAAKRVPPAFPLANTFPREGEPDRLLVTVVIPATAAAHVVGKGGKGLKQIHDISGARVSAFEVATSPDERHLSLRGSDSQIGDALNVLGKRLARKRVHYPKKAKPAKAEPSTTIPPTPATARQKSSASTKPPVVPPFLPTDRPSTSGIQEVPTTEAELFPSGDDDDDSPASEPDIQMASPPPPIASGSGTVVMATPGASTPGYLSSLSPSNLWSPMEIDRVIHHSTDSRDHAVEGLELRRAVAARLVTEGQVLHPSRLNPRAGLKQPVSGGTPPVRLLGKKKKNKK